MDQVVILARGLGTRMRKADPAVALDPALAAAADSGVKAMIPIGRPFLDYVLGVAADAGITRVCLVVGPEHGQMQEYYTQLRPRRLSIEFAVQVQALGTADAVAAAEQVVGQRQFVMINCDNYYPLQALCGLRDSPGPAVVVFDQETLVAESNIPAERISKFSVVEGITQADGSTRLKRIIEKPDEATLARLPRPLGVSMNCWRFGPAIFEACRSIKPSPRGELEITDAVQYATDRLGERFGLVWCKAPVLDLSSRNDIEPIARRLAGVKVDL
ncbi:MAG: sugar phosphate nucleotidyltransferase [Thermoguttaceae bacterium]